MAQFEIPAGVDLLLPCLLRFLPCIPWFFHRYGPSNTRKKTDKPEERGDDLQTEPLPLLGNQFSRASYFLLPFGKRLRSRLVTP